LETYDALPRTVNTRIKGVRARADCRPNSSKLTEVEEQTLISHIIDADARGYQFSYNMLAEAANSLLRDRDALPVGQHWPARFVQRVPALKTRVNRRYDYKRALNEDPECIIAWFDLVKNMREKYGIPDEDVYNAASKWARFRPAWLLLAQRVVQLLNHFNRAIRSG
jgi:hypothetical protein